jgi:coenzyme F420 biosynthesis associated uncharacterized protein
MVGTAALMLGAVAVRELTRPRPGRTPELIDWEQVRRRAIKGSGETRPRRAAVEQGVHYDEMAAQLRDWMAEALGEPMPDFPFPRFQVLDRRGWIDVNVGLFQSLMEPVLKLQEMVPATLLTDLGRRGLSHYMGVMLGFLSKRVLGQYDPVLMAPGIAGPSSLYLVEPNIEAWEEKATVRGEALRQWLVLHEVTHAWEFEAHPWLREHLNGLIRDLIAYRLFAQEKPNRFAVVRALTIGAREQWQAMSQMQASMSLLEGFSNVMMRRVGQAHLPDYEAIDAEFNHRSAKRGPAERAFFKVTGLELKMQQYVMGEKFCNHVIEARGMETLSRVWRGPDALPTLDEIRNPGSWLRRVG